MKQKKSKGEFAWRLFVRYSGDSSQYHIRNDDIEMILLDREPTTRDLKRFNPEYTFKKCWHSESRPIGYSEYCGWSQVEMERRDHRRKHDTLTPCYRAESILTN